MARPSKNKIEQKVVNKVDEKDLLTKVADITADKIVNSIASTKLSATKLLEEIANLMQSSVNDLKMVQQAKSIEEQNLQDLFNIKAEAVNLNELRELINQVRDSWEIEKNNHEKMIKERDEEVEKQRVRSENDYKYSIMIKRRDEEDAFKLTLKEKMDEVVLREKEATDKIAELSLVKQELENIKKSTQDIIDKAVKEAESKLHSKYGSELAASKRESEFQKKLSEQEIKSLQNEIIRLNNQVESLEQKASEALNMAQSITKEALQAAGKAKVEINNEGSSKSSK